MTMETITGRKPAVGLPKQLENMLGHLLRENNIKSWQLYGERIGCTLKIRFMEADMFTCSGRLPEPATDTHSHNKQLATVHYSRKPPCKLRRDQHRAGEYNSNLNIEKSRKRQRHDSSPEIARSESLSMDVTADSPASVCCEPPTEENVILAPIAPLKLDFGKDNIESEISNMGKILDGDLLVEHDDLVEPEIDYDDAMAMACQCCGMPMVDANHVCDVKKEETEVKGGNVLNGYFIAMVQRLNKSKPNLRQPPKPP